MRQLIITLFTLLSLFVCKAQPYLYGLTGTGRANGLGSISKYDIATNSLTSVHSFSIVDGTNPTGSLLQVSNGLFYGLTLNGGLNGLGTIFSFDPISQTYLKLYDFNEASGSRPFGSLIQATDGRLYGLTSQGGTNDKGVLFSYDVNTNGYTKHHDFTGTDGANPYGSLLQASNGLLYGVTPYGGTDPQNQPTGAGVLFSFNIITGTYLVLQNFGAQTGHKNPFGTFVESNGNLYGYAQRFQGDIGVFHIFRYNLSANIFSTAYSSASSFGPLFAATGSTGSLYKASNGVLYGFDQAGGQFSRNGGIFSFTDGPVSLTPLVEFANFQYRGTAAATVFGATPQGNLMQASNGILYGVTSLGGTYGQGVIFSYNVSTGTYTKLQDFNGANGGSPRYGGLVELKYCNAPQVSIPDVSVINKGGEPNTVYTGYAPAASITFTAAVANGGNYTYLWNTGQTTASITVSPTSNTNYTVTVTS